MATSSSKPSGSGRSTRAKAIEQEIAARVEPEKAAKASPAPKPRSARPTATARASTAPAARPIAPAPKPRSARPTAAARASTAAASSDGSTARSGASAVAATPQPGAPEDKWGQGLPAYPDAMQPYLPWLHQGFNALNKYLSVPSLKAGLGRYMSNPLTGYLMILRTRGRKSGEMRDAPLGYVVCGDAVYCIAGFGYKTHWFQNIKADPRVEVILPSRAFSGIAEEVTDPAERQLMLARLIRSMGLVAGAMGMGNAYRMTPETIEAKCEGLPLVRVRGAGIAAGPEDPGGWYWTVPIAASALLALVWLRGRRRHRR